MITRGWRSVSTCRCGMDLRDHPATCIDPLTDPQSWWAPRKENGMARKGSDKPEDENQATEDRIKAKALKDGEAATDKLIQDLKDGK